VTAHFTGPASRSPADALDGQTFLAEHGSRFPDTPLGGLEPVPLSRGATASVQPWVSTQGPVVPEHSPKSRSDDSWQSVRPTCRRSAAGWTCGWARDLGLKPKAVNYRRSATGRAFSGAGECQSRSARPDAEAKASAKTDRIPTMAPAGAMLALPPQGQRPFSILPGTTSQERFTNQPPFGQWPNSTQCIGMNLALAHLVAHHRDAPLCSSNPMRFCALASQRQTCSDTLPGPTPIRTVRFTKLRRKISRSAHQSTLFRPIA
jgi:hypothetical protein